MRRALLALALTACAGSDGAADSGTSTGDQAVWLTPMNAARAAVGVGPLHWDPIAAEVATSYGALCMFQHNANDSADYQKLGGGGAGLGENLAAGTSESPAEAVASWVAEKSGYDYATNTCPGGECGHYTQIVWASSTGVGCARVVCTTGSPFGGGTWDLSVCDFSPPGNYVGQKPY